MTIRPIHPIWLAAALAVAGCAQQQPQQSVAAAPAPPLAPKPAVGQGTRAAAPNQAEVTFAPGSAQLSADANGTLDMAARLFRDVDPVAMYSIGYSDPSGDEFGNILLSARRALAVKRALVARGIPPGRLSIQAFGESELADAQNPLSRQNRRVVIKWRAT